MVACNDGAGVKLVGKICLINDLNVTILDINSNKYIVTILIITRLIGWLGIVIFLEL